VPINLALQGGGSHGAFTWGVLDALLEDGSLDLRALSGTSAGALNAAVLACGLARGGRAGARQALGAFWHDVGGCRDAFGAPAHAAWASGSPLLAGGPMAMFNLDGHPLYEWMNAWMRLWSPYQFNPLNLNALREVVARHVDERALAASETAVFVTATSVATGQPVVFSGAQLSLDALMASACLPQLFQAVTIGGQAYWDGGYVGNPSLWPLYETGVLDILLVQIDPLVREGVPTSIAEIADRLNEITFNASLSAEMRAIDFVKRLLREHRIDDRRYHDLRLHRIADEAALAPLNASSKYNTAPAFLHRLFELGRGAAQRWLADERRLVGRDSSFDLREVFLADRSARLGAGSTCP
jgi:NTE family protein